MSKIEAKIKAAEAILTNPMTSPLATGGLNRRGLLARAGLVGAAALGAGLLGDSTPSAERGREGHVRPQGPQDRRQRPRHPQLRPEPGVPRGRVLPAGRVRHRPAARPDRPRRGQGHRHDRDRHRPDHGRHVRQHGRPAYAQEIADDELTHVQFLRTALGKFAVAEPSIDVSDAVFTAAANAAGITGQRSAPYAERHGLPSCRRVRLRGRRRDGLPRGRPVHPEPGLPVGRGRHPGRRGLPRRRGPPPAPPGRRRRTSPTPTTSRPCGTPPRPPPTASPPTDQGVTRQTGSANITPTDANAIAFARSFAAVLNIVYLNATATPVERRLLPQRPQRPDHQPCGPGQGCQVIARQGPGARPRAGGP